MKPKSTLDSRIALGLVAVAMAVGLGPIPAAGPAYGQPAPVCDGAPAPPPPAAGAPPLVFGTYAGGSDLQDDGPVDDPARIERALDKLQAGNRPFVVRGVYVFNGRGDTAESPARPTRYAHDGRRIDAALLFNSPTGDVESWLPYVRRTVRQLAPFARSIQIGQEQNFAGEDGADPRGGRSIEAIVRGVLAADDELRRLHNTRVMIGFNAGYTDHGTDVPFFEKIGQLGGARFAAAVDYVGVNMYPGLPEQVPSYRQAAADILRDVRLCWLPSAGLPDSTPIHVTENGWFTSSTELCTPDGSVCVPPHTYAKQAAILEEMVRAVSDYRATYNVTTYQWFGLRDMNSSVDTVPIPDVGVIPSQWGLLRDDYRPKPAFHVYRRLVAELGARHRD